MMGECHCSKIAIMQLFHELKQQFPALPDHVVSQCIAQNSHDRETCARSLRATQESRPPPGAFPPPPPQPEPLLPVDCPLSLAMSQNPAPADELQPQQQVRRRSTTTTAAHHRATRPVSLDIGTSHRRPVLQQPLVEQQQVGTVAVATHPSSAPAVYAGRSFFEELGNASVQGNPSFELNVNVACNPVSSHDYQPVYPAIEACPQTQQQQQVTPTESPRSYTSVSLTLRPPSSEPQLPIDISSQGQNLTYSSSSVDPRGFQSRLQISIGHGAPAGVTAARIKPPPAPQRPTSLATLMHTPGAGARPPGFPTGPPSQLPRPTTTMSAPVTPSGPTQSVAASSLPPISLPTTPMAPLTIITGDEPFTPPSSPPPDLVPFSSFDPRLYPASSMGFEIIPQPTDYGAATLQPGPSYRAAPRFSLGEEPSSNDMTSLSGYRAEFSAPRINVRQQSTSSTATLLPGPPTSFRASAQQPDPSTSSGAAAQPGSSTSFGAAPKPGSSTSFGAAPKPGPSTSSGAAPQPGPSWSFGAAPQPGSSTSFGAAPKPGPSTSFAGTSEFEDPLFNAGEEPPRVTPSASTGAIPRVPQSRTDQDEDEEEEEFPGTGEFIGPEEFTGTDAEAEALPPEYKALIDQVEDEFKPLVTEQLIRKYRLAKAVEEEREKLEKLRKEVEELSKPKSERMDPKEYERQLKSEIYQLQLECDKLAAEVDSRTADAQVPLGETNEEFYQSIYTGQQYIPQAPSEEYTGQQYIPQRPSEEPPPLPSQPPAWEPVSSQAEVQDEADGPSWVCKKCTFDNHPLMDKCEECYTPRYEEGAQGETQDIHIRVTHHHNFSPRRTVHNWVV